MARRTLPGSTVAEKLALNVIREGDCLRWTGTQAGKGYGQIYVGGKTERVHRVAYRLAVGEIPDGLEIDHLCRVRDCINPDHLEVVTQAENLRRRQYPVRAYCTAGHEQTAGNVAVVRKRGKWCTRCRPCWLAGKNAARDRRRHALRAGL